MTHSKVRRFLSRLTDELGTNGVLIIQKSTPGAEGEDLVPGSALRWPPCECGHSSCSDDERPLQPLAEPSAEPSAELPADSLGVRVAERNKRSRRGGL